MYQEIKEAEGSEDSFNEILERLSEMLRDIREENNPETKKTLLEQAIKLSEEAAAKAGQQDVELLQQITGEIEQERQGLE